jgi:hypothetical protein
VIVANIEIGKPCLYIFKRKGSYIAIVEGIIAVVPGYEACMKYVQVGGKSGGNYYRYGYQTFVSVGNIEFHGSAKVNADEWLKEQCID